MKIIFRFLIFFLLGLQLFSNGFSGTKNNSDQYKNLLKNAIKYQEAGDYERAIKFLNQILFTDSTFVEALYRRAMIYAELKKYELAMADLKKVEQFIPDFPNAYANLGWYLILKDKTSGARGPSEIDRDLTLKELAYRMNIGYLYLLCGDTAKAEQHYEKTYQLINQKEQADSGAIAEFQSLIENGWKSEQYQEYLSWLKHEFADSSETNIQPDKESELPISDESSRRGMDLNVPHVVGYASFDNQDDGEIYDASDVLDDFGSLKSWGTYPPFCRVEVVKCEDNIGNVIRVKYPKDKVRSFYSGACWLWENFGKHQEIYLEYRVKFDIGFEFRTGGKMHGVCGGDCNTGGNKPSGNDGWSSRIHWGGRWNTETIRLSPGSAR